MRKVSGQLKLNLAQYEEVAHFARFGTEIDRTTQRQIARGERLREVLKQEAYAPLPQARQVLILFAADRGYLDELPVEHVSRFEAELWTYAQREYRGVIRRIEEQQDLDEELEADMDALIHAFSERFL
jgi:F-type H+-transporting ATPase subunit alpha